jgi:hypothetical protein
MYISMAVNALIKIGYDHRFSQLVEAGASYSIA